MARKPKAPAAAPNGKTAPLPLGDTPGVGVLSIAPLDKAIARYETAKNKRCQASPAEIAAKATLHQLLHEHKGALPVNEDGARFYRCEDVDYILEEKLVRRKCEGGQDD